jgi:hypothetical protein
LGNRGDHTIHFKRKSLGLDANDLDTSLLGPVNTYFAPALLREEREGKARSAGHSRPMAKLCNAAPRFFVRNPEGRDGISLDPSLLAACRAYSAARLVPCSG